MTITPEYKMVSFDVVSLFTSVPLDETIDIIIKRIYDKKEINTDIPKIEMRKLLYRCTKNACFTFNSKAYLQVDGLTGRSSFSRHLYGGAPTKYNTYFI